MLFRSMSPKVGDEVILKSARVLDIHEAWVCVTEFGMIRYEDIAQIIPAKRELAPGDKGAVGEYGFPGVLKAIVGDKGWVELERGAGLMDKDQVYLL